MAKCCNDNLSKIFCNTYNKYYNTLYTNGEISKKETENLLVISYIRKLFINPRYINYRPILIKALRCIADRSCLLDSSELYGRLDIKTVGDKFVTVQMRDIYSAKIEEIDPTVPQYVKDIKQSDIINWDNKLSQETDPIFSASPAATITEEDIDNWNNPSSGGEQSDWNETDTSSLAYIKNKPTIPTVPTNVSAFNNDAGYLTQHQSIKTVNNTSLVGNGNIDLVPTETFNNFCPIIEGTRSSAVATITGVAPFSTLVDGQKILLHLNINAVSGNHTLNLTLSDNTTTGAKTIKVRYNNTFSIIGDSFPCFKNDTLPLIYNSYENAWLMLGVERNNTYSTMSQSNLNAGTSNSSLLVTPILLHDNAYIVELSYSSGSLKANKMYNFGTVSTALTIPSLDATNDLVSNALNFYALRFIAGADNISITFPTGVIVDDTPTINTGDYVEIMINLYVVNGSNNFYASIKVWQAQSQNS